MGLESVCGFLGPVDWEVLSNIGDRRISSGSVTAEGSCVGGTYGRSFWPAPYAAKQQFNNFNVRQPPNHPPATSPPRTCWG